MGVLSARGVALSLAVALTVGLAPSVAGAHSGLRRSEPAAESKLKRPPTEVKLTFSEPLEAAYSSVKVDDSGGAQVDRGDARVERSNPTILRASLPPLAPGAYTVIWRVLSVDGHTTDGRFAFQVE